VEIKYTLQGLLIYAAMGAYLLAFLVSIMRREKAGQIMYAAGFVLTCAAFGYRWYHTGHIPMQNLFEVFVTMGVVVYPLSVFCRRTLKVGAEAFDMLTGVIVLVPAGFFFSAEPKQLPPALQCWLFAPHVAVYMISYVLMGKATIQALGQLIGLEAPADTLLVDYEQGTYRMISFGFPLMTLGLILGSWWGHLAWGDYWGWDPKELWALVTWLVYLIYIHFRLMYGRRYKALNSMWAVAGMAAILITLLWANLAKLFAGLHSYAM